MVQRLDGGMDYFILEYKIGIANSNELIREIYLQEEINPADVAALDSEELFFVFNCQKNWVHGWGGTFRMPTAKDPT